MKLHHFFAGLIGAAMVMALPAAAVELGEDGLHKPAWFVETFKDLRDDLEDANAEGKRLLEGVPRQCRHKPCSAIRFA